MKLASLAALFFFSGLMMAAPSASLLILSKAELALYIVDPVSLQVEGKVPSGPDPHEVVASADGRTAYISNYGGGSLHTITVVDLAAKKNLPVIDLGPLRGPHGLVFTGGKLWFTAEGAKVIGSYDPASGKIDFVLGTGQNRTHMIYVSDDRKHLVTSNVSSGTMSIIEQTQGPGRGPGGPPPPGAGPDAGPGGRGPGPGGRGPGPGGPPRTDWNETVVKVGNGAEGFDVSPVNGEIWAANAQDGTISIIDPATETVTQTLAADVQGANRLKFTPDGKRVLVSTLSGTNLSVFDAAGRSAVKRIRIGTGAAGILMDRDRSRAFVACTPDNYVTIIDLQTLSVAGRIPSIGEPDGLAWAVR